MRVTRWIAIVLIAGCAPVARTPDAGPAEACSFSATGPCEHHTSVPVCGDAWYVVCPRGGGAGAWATHGCPELVGGEPVCADGSAVDCVHMQRCDAEWARGPGYVEGDAGSGG